MVDICADQFLFENETVTTCIDLDGYVIGPVEWELSFLKTQIKDWDSFKSGYETYQPMPEFFDFYHVNSRQPHRRKVQTEDRQYPRLLP